MESNSHDGSDEFKDAEFDRELREILGEVYTPLEENDFEEELAVFKDTLLQEMSLRFPSFDPAEYNDILKKLYYPSEGEFSINPLDEELHKMWNSLVRMAENDEMVATRHKLELATEIAYFYKEESKPLLVMIDITQSLGPKVSEMDYVELRLQNSLINGGSPERQRVYMLNHMRLNEEYREPVLARLQQVYPDSEDITRAADEIIFLAARYAEATWEMKHTDDAPEGVRDRNYRKMIEWLNVRSEELIQDYPGMDRYLGPDLQALSGIALKMLEDADWSA